MDPEPRTSPAGPAGFYARRGKRLLDVAVAAPALLVLGPLLALLALVVRLDVGPPVLFRQHRPGRLGDPFRLLKFRTMKELAGEPGRAATDEERLTRVGRLLRRTSLDELPELWNVVKGDMSLVGPRPLLTRYLPRYSPEQARRHLVRPGITGWAQIGGRNAVDWDDRLRLDVWYVDNLSFSLDCRILAVTIWKVLRGEGVSAPGHATMPEFMGGGAEPEENARRAP